MSIDLDQVYDEADHFEGDALDLYSMADGSELKVAMEMLYGGDEEISPMVIGLYLTYEEIVGVRDMMNNIIEQIRKQRMH